LNFVNSRTNCVCLKGRNGSISPITNKPNPVP
jgi:hypothetical protein